MGKDKIGIEGKLSSVDFDLGPNQHAGGILWHKVKFMHVLRRMISSVMCLQNRLFMDPDYYYILTKLWRVVLGLPTTSKSNLLMLLERYKFGNVHQLLIR